MKITTLLILILLPLTASAQRYGGYDKFFIHNKIEATPEQQFIYWVNAKRKNRLLAPLKYKQENQDKLTAVAKTLNNQYCHCHGTNYTAEVINKSLSLEDAFYSFMLSDGHRHAMMLRRGRKATVGITQADGWYYVVMRVY